MANIRVGELAKELNVTSKEVLESLKKRNVELKSNLSSVLPEDADAVRADLKKTEEEQPRRRVRPESEDGERPRRRVRPEGEEGVRVRRVRPEGEDGERPRRRIRPEGEEGVRVRRVRPDGEEGERPRRRIRPEGEEGVRVRRVRPEGEEGERPRRRIRPEGEEGTRVRRVRPEGEEGERPRRRIRPEGEEGVRVRRVRPEGEDGERPRRRIRPEGEEGVRVRRVRPEGEEGERPRRRIRPEGEDGARVRCVRPEGEEGERPRRRVRPEGEEAKNRRNMPERESSDRTRSPRTEGETAEKPRRQFRSRNERTDGDRPQRQRQDSMSAAEVRKPDGKENRRNAEKKREDRKREERQRENRKNNKNKSRGKAENKEGFQKPVKQQPKEPEIKTISIPETLTIRDLAEAMKMQPSVIIRKLFMAGVMATPNTEIDYEKAEEIALEYDILVEKEIVEDPLEAILSDPEEDPSVLEERPPVVCVMGHVDHGKTSLLDAIRATNVTSGEAGGITQHIGASVVKANGKTITFLDTPGHEAFTSMRMRGAQSTDIAILVVAADDGVMPQTIEAINHAKAAGTEIIVAINKIDKESANVERVKQELMEYDLIAEDWGGSTVFCPVSAHTKEGISDLLDMILLTAEVLELKANPNRKARGVVIEAELDKGKGAVATILVQKGTLHVGDSIAVGNAYGKIRAMVDDKGQRIKEAGPSKPVEVLGLNDVPAAGEIFIQTENEKEARSISDLFIARSRERMLADTKTRLSLDDLFDQIQAGNVKELNLVIKADVQGSVEAVKQSLLKLSNDEVVVKIVHGGVGAINESDVSLAMASNAIIIGFNVRPDGMARQIAEREKVDLRLYRVIYNAIEDIERAMKGMLDPIYEEQIVGHGEVRQIYKASGVGTIAGSYVLDGAIQRTASVRIIRDGETLFDGALASLKRFKDDVKEVKAGFECGIVLDGFHDIQEGDQIEAYIMVEVPR